MGSGKATPERCAGADRRGESQFLAARRVTLSVQFFQSEVADDAPADVAVERLVERGPDMFRMEERGARERALEDSVQQAEQSGLSADGACRLRDILSRRVDAFRRALRGDPPARVEPMRVHLKPHAQAERARPRRYDPVKTGWLASCIVALGAFGLLVRNIQVVWASPAMAVPQRDTSRLVSDYQAVNSQVEQTLKVMTDLLRGLDCKVWVKVPGVPVRSVAVHSPCDADDSLPSADVIRAAQRMVWFCVAVENDLFERHDRNQQRVCVGASKTT